MSGSAREPRSPLCGDRAADPVRLRDESGRRRSLHRPVQPRVAARRALCPERGGAVPALHDRTPLRPVREVRANLDVVPGGHIVGDPVQHMPMRTMTEGLSMVTSPVRALQRLAGWYERIIFDSAPKSDGLKQLAHNKWARTTGTRPRSTRRQLTGPRGAARTARTRKPGSGDRRGLTRAAAGRRGAECAYRRTP